MNEVKVDMPGRFAVIKLASFDLTVESLDKVCTLFHMLQRDISISFQMADDGSV